MDIYKIQRLLRGQRQRISDQQFSAFLVVCQEQKLTLQQLVQISTALYHSHYKYCRQFLLFVERIVLNDNIQSDNDKLNLKMTVYNRLASLSLTISLQKTNNKEKDVYIDEATKYICLAEKVKMTIDKATILNRAQLLLYSGDIEKAYSIISKSYEEIKKSKVQIENKMVTTHLILLAQIHFLKKNYKDALQHFKTCLKMSSNLPIKARLAMAYTFYFLNKFQMAQACFKRILEIDSLCEDAYLGLAIVAVKSDRFDKYISNLSQSYRLNSNHPLTLLHLSQHYLLRRQTEKARNFADRGLISLQTIHHRMGNVPNIRNDYKQFKGRFNNIFAQSYHMEDNMQRAIDYYTLSSGRDLLWNEIGLAFAYGHPQIGREDLSVEIMNNCNKIAEKQKKLLNDTNHFNGYVKSKMPFNADEEKQIEILYHQAARFDKQDLSIRLEHICYLMECNKFKGEKMMVEYVRVAQQLGQQISINFLNNFAVMKMENRDYQGAKIQLQKCFEKLNQLPTYEEQELILLKSKKITCKFNQAVCEDMLVKQYEACSILQSIIKQNKFYIDAYLRLAHIHIKMGMIKSGFEIIEQAEKVCSDCSNMRQQLEGVRIFKSYFNTVIGSMREAEVVMSKIDYENNPYAKMLYIHQNYKKISLRNLNHIFPEEPLKIYRDYFYLHCRQDPYSCYGFYALTLLSLTNQSITKKEGFQFFSSLRPYSAEELPNFLYNMGLFLYKENDIEHGTACFGQYEYKLQEIKSEELCSLGFLMQGKYARSYSMVKKNILRDPGNIRFRLQHSYLNQKISEAFFKKRIIEVEDAYASLQTVEKACKLYNFCQSLNFSNYLKSIESYELKERKKEELLRVKNVASERLLFIPSYKRYAQHLINQHNKLRLEKQLLNQQQKRKIQQERQKNRVPTKLAPFMTEEDKRKRAQAFAAAKKHEYEEAWRAVHEKVKPEKDQKTKKRGKGKQKVKSNKMNDDKNIIHQEETKAIAESKQEQEQYYPTKKGRVQISDLKNESKMQNELIKKRKQKQDKNELDEDIDVHKYLV